MNTMITWNSEILNRVKTGTIKSAILFGDSTSRLAPPYVVVKPIASGDRKVLQIFAHHVLGAQDILEAYILRELPALLEDPLISNGKIIHVRSTGHWGGPYSNDDNTISMSRDFYIPIVL